MCECVRVCLASGVCVSCSWRFFGDCDVFPARRCTPEAPCEAGPATSCYALVRQRSAALVISFSLFLLPSPSLSLHITTSADLPAAQRLPSLPFKGMLTIIWLASALSPLPSRTIVTTFKGPAKQQQQQQQQTHPRSLTFHRGGNSE